MISLGIDIGTTSICAVLYDLTEDKIIKSLSTNRIAGEGIAQRIADGI